jgi:hypothetical protein
MATNRSTSGFNLLWLGVIGAVIATAGYIYFYQVQPLASPWNDAVLNFGVSLAAGIGAAIATGIWRQFKPTDRPRSVWLHLALGLWAWTAAEVAWALYALAGSEPPVPSWADAFWMIGYVLFTAALLYQYRLVFHPSPNKERWYTIGIVAGVLVITLLATVVLRQLISTEEPWLTTCINVFYPFGDLAVAVAALILVRAFGWGVWGRPWIALLVFTFADTLYAWLEVTGLYSYLSEQGNPLSMAADVVYFVAYLVMALGCYSTLLLLRHGPRLRSSSPETQLAGRDSEGTAR